ncbi:MAG: DUF2254 domain-containing protein [Planctomycetales bacterium]|nr:DUF2254 domain-containing protein [Planctomycetales bacterium]
MSWKQRHQFQEFIKNSLWFGPVLAMLVALCVGPLLRELDRRLDPSWPNFTPEAARTLLGVLLASILTFITFLFSSLLVVVQLASAQLTPRVIVRAFNDRSVRVASVVLVFFYTLSLHVLAVVRDSVPQLSVAVCGYGSLVCIGLFLFLVDRVGRLIRPVAVLTSIGREARLLIESFYPTLLNEPGIRRADPSMIANLPAPEVVTNPDNVGVLLAFDDAGLVELARQHDCVIELIPQVGDFVSVDAPLFHVYGARSPIPAASLLLSIAVGPQRTMEQDPLFAFRVIVDIASKALSPAINDPTTAVLALDQIHHLLRLVGSRRLDTGHEFDQSGRLRLMYRTPDWPDFVTLATTEIRQFGRESIQIVRRLNAMLEQLVRTLPEDRGQLLRTELHWVQSDARRTFVSTHDKALATTSDSQGLGGVPEAGGLVEPNSTTTSTPS